LAVGDVALERVLDADRDPLGVELELAWIDAAGAVAEHLPDAAREQAAQIVVGDGREVADGLDPGGTQPFLGLRPDARQPAHGERREERGLSPARYDDEPARLARVARDLRDDLARRHSERAREAGRRTHRRLHGFGHDPRGQEIAGYLTHVEVALVDAGLLDGGDDAAHGVPNGAGVLAIDRVPGPEEDGLRATTQGLCAAHRGADPEAARDV